MTATLQDNTLVTRATGWLSAWIEPELVMMSADTGMYVSVSNTGGRIWELLEAPKTVGQLCKQLTDEFDVTEEAAHADVESFLAAMQEQKAVSFS